MATTMTKMTTITASAYKSSRYNNYNDYRDRDLDLDWEQFSDLVTQLTTIDKLRNLNHDIEE